MARILCGLILFLASAGCGGADPPLLSDADVDAMAEGVAKESQVRFLIIEELKLSSLKLTPTDIGDYDAAGTDAKGAEYEIKIEQQPGKIEYTWTNSKGKKGAGSFEM